MELPVFHMTLIVKENVTNGLPNITTKVHKLAGVDIAILQ